LTSAPAWRGSGTSLAKIAAGLERAGHRALILAGPDEVCARFAAAGVRVTQIPLARTGWREARLVSSVLRREGANVVLADMTRDLRLAALATFFRPLPLVFRYNLSRRVLEGHAFSRFLFRRVAAITFQSAYARERALATSPWLSSWPGEVVPNGYDGDRYRPDPAAGAAFRRRHDIALDQAMILSGAALFLDKGYELAIEAIRRLKAGHDVDWVVAGAGDDAPRITALARQAGLHVRFAGQLVQDDWFAALNAADIVVHPTPGELFPNIVAEAMLLGRPLVAVNSGATPELVGEAGAGVLVPEGDPQVLADAIGSLLADPGRRRTMGAIARERITREFPIQRMENGYVRLLERLAPSARQPV
jgi:glycosyltransferase involved in cell wall biosynthesis